MTTLPAHLTAVAVEQTAALQSAYIAETEALSERAAALVLDEVEGFLDRFVSYPSEAARVAHVLWIAHTWLMDRWESTPRIAFLSPEPGSGKSRALEVTEPLVPRSVHAVNTTPAYLFRKVSDPDGAPTILYDEIDTVFGPKAKDNEDIRGMLNAGHRRGATAGRCVVRGKTIETEEFPAYCAVALAGLGGLPDTILTRSVVIKMKKRLPSEPVEPWRTRIHLAEGKVIGEKLRAWAAEVPATMTWPTMPTGVEDRDADVWEPLLWVADCAGATWSERGRCSAVALVADSQSHAGSLGLLLLGDLRSIFSKATGRVSTEKVLTELNKLEESPWSKLRGSALDARGLATMLRRYDVRPQNIRIGEAVVRGYEVADLVDVWTRYIDAVPCDNSATSATSATDAIEAVTPADEMEATA